MQLSPGEMGELTCYAGAMIHGKGKEGRGVGACGLETGWNLASPWQAG